MSTGHQERKQARERAEMEAAIKRVEEKAVAPPFQVLACVRKIAANVTMVLGIHLEMAFPGGIGSLPGETEYDQAAAHMHQHSIASHLMNLQREAGHLTRFIDDPEHLDLPGTVNKVAEQASAMITRVGQLCEEFHPIHPQMVQRLAILGQHLVKLNLRLTEIELVPRPLIEVVPG